MESELTLTGGVPLLLLCAVLCGDGGRLTESVCLTAFLWAAAVFDFHYGLIFDRLTFLMAVLGAGFHWHGFSGVPSLLLGAVAGGAPLLLLAVLTRGGLGGGDVKLGAAAIFLLLSGRKRRGDAVAFGPFLSLGIWTAFFFGDRLLAVYEAVCFG